MYLCISNYSYQLEGSDNPHQAHFIFFELIRSSVISWQDGWGMAALGWHRNSGILVAIVWGPEGDWAVYLSSNWLVCCSHGHLLGFLDSKEKRKSLRA